MRFRFEDSTERDGITTHVLVAEDDEGKRLGQVSISMAHGQVFARDLESFSSDPNVGSRLMLKARKLLKSQGFEELNVHFETGKDDSTRQFWENIGFKKAIEIYRGKL